jgi:hypothetical protein
LENLGTGGKIILKIFVKQMRCDYPDSIYLVQNRFQWRVLVNMVTRLRVPIGGGDFLDTLYDCQFLK